MPRILLCRQLIEVGHDPRNTHRRADPAGDDRTANARNNLGFDVMTRIGEVERQYQYMRRAGIRGHHTYDHNLMIALAGQLIAMRSRLRSVYPELTRETEAA